MKVFASGFAALALGFMAAPEAQAQVAISGNYYEELAQSGSGCNPTTLCSVHFTAVPQNVLISYLSCLYTSSVAIGTSYLGVADSSNTQSLRRREILPSPAYFMVNGFYEYAVIKQTNFLFGAGKFPTVNVSVPTSGNISLECKITGTLQ
ncbi:MAG: hypothetical protein JOZ16_05440 [Methylobacteriaceae bacterium]|nr:hypothetical protein [Methylobacteriaceae bacterium]